MSFRSIIIACSLFLFASDSYAAQNGLVARDGAEVYSTPEMESHVLQTLQQNDRIRISSGKKNGWYKVFLNDPKSGKPIFGWMAEDDLIREDIVTGLKEAGIQEHATQSREENRSFFNLTLFGAYSFYRPQQVQDNLNLETTLLSNLSLGGELGYRITHKTTLSARVESIGYESDYTTDAGDGTYSAKATLIALILDYSFIYEKAWRVGFGAGLGVAAGSTQKTESDTTTLETDSKTLPQVLVKFGLRYYLSPRFALMTALGYRYSIEPSSDDLPTANSFGLSAPFVNFGISFDL